MTAKTSWRTRQLVDGGHFEANFGVTRLRSLLTPSGRFSDRSEFGDFNNAFTQPLAIITLCRRLPPE
jgi:hypothetical protein